MFPRNVLEKTSLPKIVQSLPELLLTFSDEKRTQKCSRSEKRLFRSGIKIFSLGAFTGYPVLPGVSASLSDGKREYREKQMIIAMVAQSSSEHDLQKLLGV